MVDKCVRCGIDGNDVRLFDAIYDGQMENICERCSIIENVPIIKKPTSVQLKESEKAPGVYDRMKKISGVLESKSDESFFIDDKLKELDTMPELELPEQEKLNLIDHFHWHIMKHRRKKGLTQEQLAKSLGEGDISIQMIEKGKLPENAETLLKKLEQFLQIKLTRISDNERMLINQQKNSEPILLDEFGKELETIPEPEFEVVMEEVEEDRMGEESPLTSHPSLEEADKPEVEIDIQNSVDEKSEEEVIEIEDFKIKESNSNAVTIADLRELHRKKVDATKQEKFEEQRKIEERQRLIEAKKEELRLLKERESKELDGVLGGVELLEGNDKVRYEDDLI